MLIQRLSRRQRIILPLAIIPIALFITWGIWALRQTRNNNSIRCQVAVERESWYELKISGKTVLFFASLNNGTLTDVSTQREPAITIDQSEGRWVNRNKLWPSCKGSLIANFDTLDIPKNNFAVVAKNTLPKVESHISDLKKMKKSIDYYLDVHDSTDICYDKVIEKQQEITKKIMQMDSVADIISQCKNGKVSIEHQALYKVRYMNVTNFEVTDTCTYEDGLIQLKNKQTPKGMLPLLFYDKDKLSLQMTKTPHKDSWIEANMPDGFGIKVSMEGGVQVGEWKDNKFVGEQFLHKTSRVYGIDLSRYQHEKGGKKYDINWTDLRVIALGEQVSRTSQDDVDYPVSYCFLKSTEGNSFYNAYYTQDYVQARAHGLKVGTYHFLSTKTSGAEQARWFLKKSLLKKGDIAPVLDIEPTDAQVKVMGGKSVLAKNIRAWLKIVEQATNTKPILYVNMKVVNDYLSDDKDLLEDYPVWLARYAVYRPNIEMDIWQFSADGKVKGITPEVDLNVFNGNKRRYEKFIKKHIISL